MMEFALKTKIRYIKSTPFPGAYSKPLMEKLGYECEIDDETKTETFFIDMLSQKFSQGKGFDKYKNDKMEKINSTELILHYE